MKRKKPKAAPRRASATAAAGLVLIGALGCTQTPKKIPPPPPPEESAFQTVELGRSVQGRPIEGVIFSGRRPCVFVLGGIHGSEPSSATLVEAFVDLLVEKPEIRDGRMLVIIPRANPDGLAALTRENANGVDLNRNFETRNFRSGGPHGPHPLSEPESRLLVEVIQRYLPSAVISVHAPLNCIDPDGQAASSELARAMAAVGGLPVRDLKAMPGSMGTYVGIEQKLTMVTYELERKTVPSVGTEAYLKPHLEALVVAVQRG